MSYMVGGGFVIRLYFIYALLRLRYSAAADLSDGADSSHIARFLVRINATTKAQLGFTLYTILADSLARRITVLTALRANFKSSKIFHCFYCLMRNLLSVSSLLFPDILQSH